MLLLNHKISNLGLFLIAFYSRLTVGFGGSFSPQNIPSQKINSEI